MKLVWGDRVRVGHGGTCESRPRRREAAQGIAEEETAARDGCGLQARVENGGIGRRRHRPKVLQDCTCGPQKHVDGDQPPVRIQFRGFILVVLAA